MFNIIEKRTIFFIISALIIVAGIAGYFVNGGFNADIDFTGGSEIYVKFDAEYNENEIRDTLKDIEGVQVSSVQKVEDGAIIRTTELNPEQKIAVQDALNTAYSVATEEAPAEEAAPAEEVAPAEEAAPAEEVAPIEETPVEEEKPNTTVGKNAAVQSIDNVSASMGKDLWKSAATSILFAVILMLIYITFRFELLTGISAVVALCHDILVMLCFYVLFKIPVNTSFIAALLTILGYSINATIVVFDKIRENTRFAKKESFANIVNKSIWQTIARSINTSITTLIVLVALYIMGVPSIKEFALPLIVGVICGCYSSVFIAGNIWVLLKGKNAMVVNK